MVPGTKAVFFESMSNPALELVDIASVSGIAHAVGALVIVDNVFATPIYSQAVAQGADVVVYSSTKHIDGQGKALGGVGIKRVVCNAPDPAFAVRWAEDIAEAQLILSYAGVELVSLEA